MHLHMKFVQILFLTFRLIFKGNLKNCFNFRVFVALALPKLSNNVTWASNISQVPRASFGGET